MPNKKNKTSQNKFVLFIDKNTGKIFFSATGIHFTHQTYSLYSKHIIQNANQVLFTQKIMQTSGYGLNDKIAHVFQQANSPYSSLYQNHFQAIRLCLDPSRYKSLEVINYANSRYVEIPQYFKNIREAKNFLKSLTRKEMSIFSNKELLTSQSQNLIREMLNKITPGLLPKDDLNKYRKLTEILKKNSLSKQYIHEANSILRNHATQTYSKCTVSNAFSQTVKNNFHQAKNICVQGVHLTKSLSNNLIYQSRRVKIAAVGGITTSSQYIVSYVQVHGIRTVGTKVALIGARATALTAGIYIVYKGGVYLFSDEETRENTSHLHNYNEKNYDLKYSSKVPTIKYSHMIEPRSTQYIFERRY